ncbi:MAG: YcjF family protein [Lachnospiraceae bacterium]|nr:YcjF family protein [Lachnospiraceae bacterium]
MEQEIYKELEFENQNEKELKDAIYDYEETRIREEDRNSFGYIIKLIIVVFGLFVISLLLNISDRIRNFNQVAGLISLVIFAILFLYFYVRPILSIYGMLYFESRVQGRSSRLANAHNIKTRKKIAEHIINFNQHVKDANWYDKVLVQELKVAVHSNDNQKIFETLTKLMNGSIKKASNKLIVTSAVQSGVYSAIVPSQQLDALLVAGVNFKMIRDILFLYGFRPTNARLVKIFINSIIGSLAAYGIEGSGIGSFIAKLGSRAIPIINESSSFLVDAGVQAFTNGTLTMWIGYKAIDYLKKEYKLQVVLGDIDVLDDDKEFDDTRKEVVSELKDKMPFINKTISKMTENSNHSASEKGNANEIVLPVDSKKYIGKNFIDVEKKLLEIGFLPENIYFVKVERGRKGFFQKEGEVVEILINGIENIHKGYILEKNAKVVIKYAVYGYFSINK